MSTNLLSQRIGGAFFRKRGDTVFAWLGMASVGINARGTVILIDPLLVVEKVEGKMVSETGHPMRISLPIEAKEVPRLDAVMYTHADADHCARPTVEILNRLEPVFVAPPRVLKELREMGVPEERMIAARDFERVRIGEVEVEVTPALHDYAASDYKRGDCCGFVVRGPDGAIWHPGDTRLIDELLEVKGVDVIFFDVAAVEAHLGPQGSARLAESSGAKAMIAYHYGTYEMPAGTWGGCDPEDAARFVEGVNAEFVIPNPGEVLRLSEDEVRR